MPNITAPSIVYPVKSFPGASAGCPSGIAGELLFSELMARYSHLVKAGRMQCAYATLAASSPVIFTTNTLTGGPFLWNPPGSAVDAHVIAASVVETVIPSTGTAGGFGLTYGPQNAIPAAQTPIDFAGNCLIGGPASALTVLRTATPAVAGPAFMPFFQVGLTAVSANFCPVWTEFCGAIIVPPGNYCSLAGSSTMTNGVFRTALMWAELPT